MEETNADVLVRPPLPPDHPFPADYSALPFARRRALRSVLCRMYAATEIMELGTESRFTSLVLFQRYYFASLDLTEASASSSSTGSSTRNSSTSNNENDDTEEVRRWREHLGTVAAACLFLGCKAEEEHRRIRDVINVAHMLDFAAEHGDDDDKTDEAGKIASTSTSVNDAAALTGTGSGGASQAGTSDTAQSKSKSTQTSTICIHEAARPPELDDTYWETKEHIVATEQEILRILRFDVSVSHPHRAVLLILDGLGIGANDMQKLVKKAWELLNNALFYPPALRYPLLPLACGAIRLGENIMNDGGNNANEKACSGRDEGSERIKMPTNWWTDLGVTEHEIKAATLSLQHASGTQ